MGFSNIFSIYEILNVLCNVMIAHFEICEIKWMKVNFLTHLMFNLISSLKKCTLACMKSRG